MSKAKPLFSVVVIAKNEAKTLPRLVASLKEFQERGGQIVVLDTASTDDTRKIAESLGCEVHASCGFNCLVDDCGADAINEHFLEGREPLIVKDGDRYFDYAAARNYAAEFSTLDIVAMPDCDEIYTALDIDKINEAIRNGAEQLEYDFVFSHDAQGRPLIQFMHCKFYDRRKLKWQGIIHEVLIGEAKRQYLPPSVIKLEHWQNPETKRGHYLTGLAVDCYEHPENDRNSHYFARELFWSGRLKTAKKEFERHIMISRFAGERAESMCYLGDILTAQGNPRTGCDWYLQATMTAPNRRIGFLRLAQYWYKNQNPQATKTWASAALTIPWNSYYGNNMDDYRHIPHEMLYWAEWNLGNKVESGEHWKKCMEFQPHSEKFLHDARFYMDLPRVSIIIPHVFGTREDSLRRLQQLIQDNANYPNYEVVVAEDKLGVERNGVANTFNRAVRENTDGCDYVMFLGDDCEPQPNFLVEAMLCLKNTGTGGNLVALNDGLWNGKLATHWLAPKDFAKSISCDCDLFLWPGYYHVGCDNELTARAKKAGRYSYCEHARVIHNPPEDAVHAIAWNPALVDHDRRLLSCRAAEYKFEEIK